MTNPFDEIQSNDPFAAIDSDPFAEIEDTPGFLDQLGASAEKIGKDVYAGYRAGGASFYNTAANLFELLNRGMPEDTGLGQAEQWLRGASERMAPDYYPEDIVGKINAGLGSAPAILAEYAAPTRFLGPVAGFAATDALRAADQGLAQAIEEAVKGAAMGKFLAGTPALSTPARTGSMAALGGGVAAAEGGDPSDIASSAAVMGTLGLAQPGGPVTARESIRSAVEPAARAVKERVAKSWNPGSAHTRMLEGALPVGKLEINKKPISRDDVIIPLLKSMGLPIYHGRTKRHGAVGLYYPKKETVRVEKYGDYEVAVHELGHAIDDRIFGFGTGRPWRGRKPKAKTYANELRELSYDKKKVYEGFAEYVRNWVTQPEVVRAKAPEFTKYFDNLVETHKYGPALKQARENALKYQEQSGLDRLQTKIGDQQSWLTTKARVGDELRQGMLDDLHGFNLMERDLTGKINPLGVYETARTSRGGYAMVDGALTIGAPKVLPDGSHTFTGKSLQQVLDPVMGNYKEFALYAVARSAKELKSQGRENLITKSEIEAGMKLETPAMKKAFDDYQVWNKAVVDFAEAKGLINPQLRELWNRTDYLPFFRVTSPGMTKKSAGMEGLVRPIKRLTGGDANIKDPLGNMIQNASQLMQQALNNEVRLKAVDLARKQRGGGRFLARISPDVRAEAIDKPQIQKFVDNLLGIDRKAVDMGAAPDAMIKMADALDAMFLKHPDYINFWKFGQVPAEKGQNIVAVLRNGKPEYYEVADPLVYRAFESLNRPAQHWLMKLFSVPKRIGQSSITLTPDFLAANMARDTLTGSILSKNGFVPFVDSARGLWSRMTKDQNYRDFIANGGGFSSYYTDPATYRTHLEKYYTDRGVNAKSLMHTPARALDAFEHLADSFEMSARLGEFRKAIKSGAHPRHAAYRGREVSTDFGMRGDYQALNFLYDSVMFLKAGVNGLDRIYRGFTKDSNKAAIAAKSGLLAAFSAGLYTLNRGNPLYEELPDWDKDTAWHFFIPNENYYRFVMRNGREPKTPEEAATLYSHWRYPKIWEIGAMSSIAERTMERLYDSESPLAQNAGRVLMDQFKLDWVPQTLKPLYEVYALNRNRFTDVPIEPMSLQRLEPWARAKPYTPESLKELGEKTRNLPKSMQVSPAKAEALLRGYFNTWALYGMALAEALDPNAPAMRTDQLPVLRRFYSGKPARHTKYEGMYYDAMKELDEVRNTMRAMDKMGRTDIAEEREGMLSEIEDRTGVGYDTLDFISNELLGIRKEMQDIRRNPFMSPKEKRKALQEKQREINLYYEGAFEEVQ